jgi:GTPase SAR1 family protein
VVQIFPRGLQQSLACKLYTYLGMYIHVSWPTIPRCDTGGRMDLRMDRNTITVLINLENKPLRRSVRIEFQSKLQQKTDNQFSVNGVHVIALIRNRSQHKEYIVQYILKTVVSVLGYSTTAVDISCYFLFNDD